MNKLSDWTWAKYERTGVPYVWLKVLGIEVRLQFWPPQEKGGRQRFRWDVKASPGEFAFGYTFSLGKARGHACLVAESMADGEAVPA